MSDVSFRDELTMPDRIWLQIHMGQDITWCEDQIEDSDVEYFRADEVERIMRHYLVNWGAAEEIELKAAMASLRGEVLDE